MTDTVVIIFLVGVGLFIAIRLFRAVTAEPEPEGKSAETRSTEGAKRKRRKRKKRKKRAAATGQGSSRGDALPKVRVEEDEELELTKVTLPSLAALDEDTVDDSELPPSSEPNVVPIVYDENADVDIPTQNAAFFLLSAIGQSEKGRRKRNEDCYLMLEDPPVYAVADGMGGYAGGDVASRMTVEVLDEALARTNPKSTTPHLPSRAAILVDAVVRANFDVYERAQEDRRFAEMGTTLVCARFSPHKRRVYIAHVGDSRCYVYRGSKLHQITSDHTLAEIHGVDGPTATHLVRAIGVRPVVEIDLILGRPAAGDRYILCSDGLCRGLSDDQIAQILEEEPDPEAAVSKLVDGAIEGGSRDNVTVIVVNVESTASSERDADDGLNVAS